MNVAKESARDVCIKHFKTLSWRMRSRDEITKYLDVLYYRKHQTSDGSPKDDHPMKDLYTKLKDEEEAKEEEIWNVITRVYAEYVIGRLAFFLYHRWKLSSSGWPKSAQEIDEEWVGVWNRRDNRWWKILWEWVPCLSTKAVEACLHDEAHFKHAMEEPKKLLEKTLKTLFLGLGRYTTSPQDCELYQLGFVPPETIGHEPTLPDEYNPLINMTLSIIAPSFAKLTDAVTLQHDTSFDDPPWGKVWEQRSDDSSVQKHASSSIIMESESSRIVTLQGQTYTELTDFLRDLKIASSTQVAQSVVETGEPTLDLPRTDDGNDLMNEFFDFGSS